MPRASGPVPFELGVCAGHVVRIGLRTQNYRKSQGKGRGKKREFKGQSQGKGRGKKMRNKQRAAKGQKMRSQRTKKNRKSQGKTREIKNERMGIENAK
jgi:hypothetical protein